MAATAKQFSPDYAVPPGWILEERLAANEISHAEFARRCGRSAKLISEIISGKASLEPETALQFEKVLGVSANVWLALEAKYQLKQARDAEAEAANSKEEWAKSFPINDLVKRGCFHKPKSLSDAVSKLLTFFGVASVDAWSAKYSDASIAYRHSAAFDSDVAALSTWFRLGELAAEQQSCEEYSASKFRMALSEIRLLTRERVEESLPRAKELCNSSGVALVLVKPLPKTALSGAAWWRSANSAVVQLSARHKTDDHLWFSFFHEAAHILLHGKKHNKMKNVFVDGKDGDGEDIEIEANDWASDFLIPRKDWETFVASRPRSAADVREFSEQQGIAPGIVVGRLQKAGVIPWSNLNGLKTKLEWVQ
ncbi:HigA family addiction module antitoxin [Marimonas lutisalis]|uniref:HigA family addiction module antitoxin n=1 Tax=Marimonas lutisalis TaxID=2545756 RepID=UPI0013760995|nr:HigA family addiction module antitoxin [Marimonas lutisalis]